MDAALLTLLLAGVIMALLIIALILWVRNDDGEIDGRP